LLGQSRREIAPAPVALARDWRHPILATAVGIQRGGAVRTEDPQICQAVIGRDAVDVVEDQGHALAAPELALSAHLAFPFLHPLGEEPELQMAAVVTRVLYKDIS
jgi:hypothetical protein